MKIAIVKLSALGDIVHTMVILQGIKKIFPKAQIDWIVEEAFEEVLQYNSDINAIYTVNLKALKKDVVSVFSVIKQVWQYRKHEYDLVIDYQGLIKSAVVSKLLGKSIGFDRYSIRESLASYFYHKSCDIAYDKNVLLRNVLLTECALDRTLQDNFLIDKKPFLCFQPSHKAKMEVYFDTKQKNIVYMLGSSWESKVYPKEKYVEVIKGLDANHLLVWGSELEHKSATYIAQHTHARILPKMTLNELKALVAQADLVIGGDSGPTHFGWGLNRPSITIFGPTPSQRNTLLTPINKSVDCGNSVNPLALNKQDFCIQNVNPNKVIDMAKRLLKNG